MAESGEGFSSEDTFLGSAASKFITRIFEVPWVPINPCNASNTDCLFSSLTRARIIFFPYSSELTQRTSESCWEIILLTAVSFSAGVTISIIFITWWQPISYCVIKLGIIKFSQAAGLVKRFKNNLTQTIKSFF